MEDLESQHLSVLSAHVQGLEAALGALHADDSLAASLRRLARSLATAADAVGAADIASRSRTIQEADDADLELRTRELLDHIESVRDRLPENELGILLVEDNRTVAIAVAAYLKGGGRTVHHAATAAEAETILAEEAIDLVLLDLILPDRDGRDLLVQMRESRATAAVPVIVLSGTEGAVAKAECLAVGAAEFLEKPVRPQALRAAVARHARRREPERDAPSPGTEKQPATRADLVERFETLRTQVSSGASVSAALIRVDDAARVEDPMDEAGSGRLVDAVANHLLEGLGELDTLGRWTHADLVVLLPGSSSRDAKQKITDGLRRLAGSAALSEFEAAALTLTFSAGVAVAEPKQDLRDVVSAAETSLLNARRAGQKTPLVRQQAPAGPPRILLVEDDRVTATLIHHRLTREGFEVMDYLNGEDAFAWAEESSFDLAILDVKVPGMDGFELLERLRAIPRLEEVPIVMLTGLGSEADVIRGLELGANDYMLKPFSPTELLARVRRLLYSTGGAEEVDAP